MTTRQLRSRRRADTERGDVPGWVLITLMTAMLVVALMAVAQDRLIELFNRAMDALV
jgi:Tfp pilus assembly protein PilX